MTAMHLTEPSTTRQQVGSFLQERPFLDRRLTDRLLDPRPGGILFLPAGTYRLSRQAVLLPQLQSIIIRGAGRDVTTLFYTKSFKDLNPAAYAADSTSFSSAPFLLNLVGRWSPILVGGKNTLANITGTNKRGKKRCNYLHTV